MPNLALNHMTSPKMRYDAFLSLARDLGCCGVEFRNDLATPLFGGDSPENVRRAAEAAGIRILALAEVKAFNDWSDDKLEEVHALINVAKACGAEAISLIPRNDGLGLGKGERRANLRVALREILPLLKEYGLTGMVEPLGFEICALRYKSEAVEAIESLGASDHYKLIHDTFHHFLAGGGPIFPEHTGVVHISGIVDPAPSVSDMNDAHRVLVDAHDRLGNIEQLQSLLTAGYDGPISYEPFSPVVHNYSDPKAELSRSFDFITNRLAAIAA